MAARSFTPKCPRCGTSLAVRRFRVPGSRALADGDCGVCKHRYLVDRAGWLNLSTGDSPDPWLPSAWARPDDAEAPLRFVRRKEVPETVLAACLDTDLGRAREKLTAAVGRGANALIVPAALEGTPVAAELWVVDIELDRAGHWLRDLEERVESELSGRASFKPVEVPTPPVMPEPRASAVTRVLDRARAGLSRKPHEPEPELPRQYTGPLPAVLPDSLGFLFEIDDREHATSFVNGGHFERDEIELASRYLGPGMTAVDVGANRGAFTAAMARSVAPGGMVHAFEPGGAARAQLERTIELNELSNVEVVPVAVAGRTGEAALADFGPGFESWGSLVRHEIDRGGTRMLPVSDEAVPTITLDDYCGKRGIDRVDLLKVDVEGAEPLVLAGAGRLLERGSLDVILIEVADVTLSVTGATSHGLLDVLEGSGLRTYVLDGGELVPFRVSAPVPGLAQVIAASRGGRDRLNEVGYSVR